MKINKTIWKCDACGKEVDGKPAGWLQLETPLKSIHLCTSCAYEYVHAPPMQESWADMQEALSRVITRQNILRAVIKGSVHEGEWL